MYLLRPLSPESISCWYIFLLVALDTEHQHFRVGSPFNSITFLGALPTVSVRRIPAPEMRILNTRREHYQHYNNFLGKVWLRWENFAKYFIVRIIAIIPRMLLKFSTELHQTINLIFKFNFLFHNITQHY